jgi:hypothetical protein
MMISRSKSFPLAASFRSTFRHDLAAALPQLAYPSSFMSALKYCEQITQPGLHRGRIRAAAP